MTGKLKISGNILAAQKLQQLWLEESPKSLIEEESASPSSTLNKSSNQDDDKALLEAC